MNLSGYLNYWVLGFNYSTEKLKKRQEHQWSFAHADHRKFRLNSYKF